MPGDLRVHTMDLKISIYVERIGESMKLNAKLGTFFSRKAFGLTTILALSGCNSEEIKEQGQFSADASEVLLGVCVQCHAYGRAEKGFGYVNDVDKMIDLGKIVPGNSASSRIYQKVSTDWGSGARMPLRGPYLGPREVEGIGFWIDQDLYQSDPSNSWTVTVNATSAITVDRAGANTVTDGETLEMSVTTDLTEVEITADENCADAKYYNNSNYFKPSVKDGKYTTLRIKSNCTLTFSDPNSTNFSVTMAAAYGIAPGETPNIAVTSQSNQEVEPDGTATFEFTVREGDTIADVSAAGVIETDCGSGTLEVVSADDRTYRYTTASITGDCSISVKTDDPCPTIVDGDVTWDNLFGAGGEIAETQRCSECHVSGGAASEAAFMEGQIWDLDSLKAITAGGKTLIVAGDPMNSGMLLQYTPNMNYASGQMPSGGTKLTVDQYSKLCKYIKSLD